MSKQNTNPNLMKEGDFEKLLCKANKQREVKRATLEVKDNKVDYIKTKTPLFRDIMKSIGVDVI